MEILLVDVGALALFLVSVVLVYWHAVSEKTSARPPG